MPALIEFKDVVKEFKNNKVLNGLSLDIEKGEVFGIIGKSGCGKSTLLKVLIGVYSIDSGSIVFDGRDVTNKANKLKRFVGVTTQENSFYEKLTIYENMAYYANLNKVKAARKHIDSILESVGLLKSRNQLAGSISGGMKRRLDFAISLVHDPSLLVLDEPTTGLDPLLVKQFWKVVEKVRSKGKTVIVISHLFSELQESCKRIGILHDGVIKKIITVGKNVDLYKEFVRTVR